jgi:hypothetical protein
MRSLWAATFGKKIILTLLVVSAVLLPTFFAHALSVLPATGEYNVGQTFTARIVVDVVAQAVNAVDTELTFPVDKLQVVSVSKSNSILSFWVEEPAFSNSLGTLHLAGVVPNPGWTGSSANVIVLFAKSIAVIFVRAGTLVPVTVMPIASCAIEAAGTVTVGLALVIPQVMVIGEVSTQKSPHP